jgi:hypothetical protein
MIRNAANDHPIGEVLRDRFFAGYNSEVDDLLDAPALSLSTQSISTEHIIDVDLIELLPSSQ